MSWCGASSGHLGSRDQAHHVRIPQTTTKPHIRQQIEDHTTPDQPRLLQHHFNGPQAHVKNHEYQCLAHAAITSSKIFLMPKQASLQASLQFSKRTTYGAPWLPCSTRRPARTDNINTNSQLNKPQKPHHALTSQIAATHPTGSELAEVASKDLRLNPVKQDQDTVAEGHLQTAAAAQWGCQHQGQHCVVTLIILVRAGANPLWRTVVLPISMQPCANST